MGGKTTWGIVLIVAGLLFISAEVRSDPNDPNRRSGPGVLGIPMLISGCVLVYLGRKYQNQQRDGANEALVLLRHDGKINALEIVAKLGIGEPDVRIYITEAKRQ